MSFRQRWLWKVCFGVGALRSDHSNAISALADEIRRSLGDGQPPSEARASEDAPPAPRSPPMSAAARKLGVGLSDAPSASPKTPPAERSHKRKTWQEKARSRANLMLKSPKRTFQTVILRGVEVRAIFRGGGGGAGVAADPSAPKA
eukprot:13282076-Alexandrium_andersonii.AAC.1